MGWCHYIPSACCCLATWWEKAPWDAAAGSLGSQTCLHLLCSQGGFCSSPGLLLSMNSLLPFPIQMKPSFSPHAFSHCSYTSFPTQSFGNSSCPSQLQPFFPPEPPTSRKIYKHTQELKQALAYFARQKMSYCTGKMGVCKGKMS